MEICEVRNNCLNELEERGQCWMCDNYNQYRPKDRKILSPFQIEKKEKNKQNKKEKKASEASKRGKKSKKKGYAAENEVVKLLQKYNIDSERVPLSGSLKGKFAGDVNCIINKQEKTIEVKRRKEGFKTIYNAINQDACTNYLFMREDRNDWLVCMKFEEFLELIK